MSPQGLGEGAARTVAAFVLLLSVAWNVFVLWFFLRPAVKAQFLKTADSK